MLMKTKIDINPESHYSRKVMPHTQKYYKKLFTPPVNNEADTILQWLYNRGLVQNYIKKLEYETIDEETIQDEIQEMWLYLVEKKDKLKELYDMQGITGLTAYVSGVIARQIHSNTSSIYKKYKKDYKFLIHISEKAWEVYDHDGVMQHTTDDYSTTENEIDIIKKNIENNTYEQ